MKPNKGDRVKVRIVAAGKHHGFTPGEIMEGTYDGPDWLTDCDVVKFDDGRMAGTGYACEVVEILTGDER